MLQRFLLTALVIFVTSVSWVDLKAEDRQPGDNHRFRLREIIKERIRERRQNNSKDDSPAFYRNNYIQYSSSGHNRQYILVTPKIKQQKTPLVVVLHGTYGSGEKMQRGLGFDSYVDKYGFAVAYPDAYTPPGKRQTLRWNDGRGTLDSSEQGIDDVRAIRDMVSDISNRIPVDRNRIFVTGASNGGIMSYRLACEAADLFAGAAPVIGNIAAPIANSCHPSMPISILAINGTDDPFIPLNGGTVCKNVKKLFCEKGEVISSIDSLGTFAMKGACSKQPKRTMIPPKVQDGTSVEELDFSPCITSESNISRTATYARKVQVKAYWIHGGGHVWPPRQGQLGEKSGKASKNLDATKEILEFFLSLKSE